MSSDRRDSNAPVAGAASSARAAAPAPAPVTATAKFALSLSDTRKRAAADAGGSDPYNTSGSFDRKKHWERVGRR